MLARGCAPKHEKYSARRRVVGKMLRVRGGHPSCPVSGAKDSDRIRAPSTSVHIQQPGGAHARPGELTIPSFFRSPIPPCDPPVTVDGLPLCDERDVASGGVVQQAGEVGAQTSRLANSGAPRRPSSAFSWQCGAGEAQRVVEPRCHLREPCQRPRGAGRTQ